MSKNCREKYDALLEFVEKGDLDSIKVILDEAIGPNDHGIGDQSALILAANEGQIEIFGYLLLKGANVNYEDDAGDTPLICSVVVRSEELVKLCIQSGAEKSHKNRFGVTALDYAEQNSIGCLLS